MRRILAVVVAVVVALSAQAPTTAVAGEPASDSHAVCDVLSPSEIHDVFGFDVEVDDALSDKSTLCTWDRPLVGSTLTCFNISVGIDELSKKTIRSGVKFEKSRPKNRVLRKVGDFAVYRHEKGSFQAEAGCGGVASILVVDGTTVFTVRALGETETPTSKGLVRLARLVLGRI